jgi:hypothetical protein
MRERSLQTLSEADRRIVAAWAADCVERVLGLFESESPDDNRVRVLIERTRAFARGELNTADEIRNRFTGGVSASELKSPAAKAVARAAGQAVAVCHVGAHALSAAACAVRAVGFANPNHSEATQDEIRWQLDHMSPTIRSALMTVPPIDKITSGPLGPGLNTTGQMGDILRDLQAGLIEAAKQADTTLPSH